MKRNIIIFGILFIFLFILNIKGKKQASYVKDEFIVVLDAGHGGKDPGAVGKNSYEKDIALKITLKVGNYMAKNFPNVKIHYTRETDVFVELYRRAQIANELHADLFISIHCNSCESSSPQGFETWVMGLHKNESNLAVAKKENAAMLLEDDYQNQYDGFNPNSDEAYITLSLFQDAYLGQSIDLAYLIQKQFKENLKKNDRGVKQAGFYVLWKTAMPGILIETGFISNAEEEKYLNTEEGQTYIASAIYRAFKEYYKQYRDDIPIVDVFEEPNNNVINESVVDIINNKPANNDLEKAVFKVQFYISSKKQDLNSDLFKEISDVSFYQHGNMYKYVSGNFNNIDDAIKQRNNICNNIFKDAFIVAFYKGERISVAEAEKINKQY